MENITEGMKFKSNVTEGMYTFVRKQKSPAKNYTDILLRSDLSKDLIYVPEHKLLKCFTPQKFIAVSGDQSLFDLVLAKDNHLYVVRNTAHRGIYATDYKLAKGDLLAERKLIEPEFIPYHTDTYLHEDGELEDTEISAFRSRLGNLTCINVTFGSGNVEVVLDKGQNIKFAEELIAIANGVDRKE